MITMTVRRSWDRLFHGVLPPERVPAPLRSRRGRRALVLLLAGAWVATVLAALPAAREALPRAWAAPLSLAVAAWLLLTVATRNLSSARDAYSDEREQAVRDRAHRLAYWILAFPSGVVFGAAVGLFHSHGGEPTEVVLTTAHLPWVLLSLGSYFGLYLTLPAAILGWTEPDPPEELPEPV